MQYLLNQIDCQFFFLSTEALLTLHQTEATFINIYAVQDFSRLCDVQAVSCKLGWIYWINLIALKVFLKQSFF